MAEDVSIGDTGESSGPRRSGLTQLLRALTGRNGDSHLRDALEDLIEKHDDREKPIDQGERALIANILKFGEMTAYDVMVPRADIHSVDIETPLKDLLKEMVHQPHSRYPVYRGELDDILGMVHIKDVMAIGIDKLDGFDLQAVLRPILIVAPSMRVLDLLLQMRLQRRHMAVVVDEYGGIDGLITIEDLVEEIVGEIADEHDIESGPVIEAAGDGTYIADARLPIEDLEKDFGPILEDSERDEDIDTVGGLVFTMLGRVPTRGELITHEPSGISIEILDADPRRIKRVRVHNLPDAKMTPIEG